MDITILGAGKFGRTLCEQLSLEEHNITVIDVSDAVVDKIVEDYDVLGIIGDGMNIETLTEAGAGRADIFIATTAADEKNMMSALFAKKLGAKHVVARVRNPLYRKQTGFMREEMGISLMINPELEAAREISRMLKFPAVAKIETFAKGRVEMAEVRIPEESELCNLSLREIGKKIKSNALICSVERGDEIVIPNGDFILRSGDKINLTAAHSELAAFLKESGIITSKIRSVMIIGCGATGFYLAKLLGESGIRVKIIDNDLENCERINNLIPKADVICADGTNHQVLVEEGLLTCDALVSLTGVDEENIIVSLFAKAKGVEKVITKVNNTMLLPIIDSFGLDSIITPKDVAANIVNTYVRAKENAKGSKVLTLYKLAGGRIEALEFSVAGEGDYIGRKLKDLSLRENVLIGAIVKGNKLIIPNGDSTLETGDRVMVVAENSHFDDLSQLFV